MVKYNQYWFFGGGRQIRRRKPTTGYSHFPEKICNNRGAHDAHLWKGNFCRGHSFDYT